MFNKGYNPSTLNVIRSSLSFFCEYSLKLGEDPYVGRLFKSFYKLRPPMQKHITFWPVNQLLNYLAKLHPPKTLCLKQLTLKTVALVALTSSDRGQTIHAMNTEYTELKDGGINFYIFDRLKTSALRRPKPKTVKCISSDVDSLNVSDYVYHYMNRTIALRASVVAEGKPKPTNLFISWKTKQQVTKQSIARWLKEVLTLADINTEEFSAHSYRGAGLSNAYAKGATTEQIMKAGDWKNVDTFLTYYNKPSTDSSVGKMILENYKTGGKISIRYKKLY